MNCKDCRHNFSSLMDRRLAPPERQATLDHLQRCAGCARELRDLRATLQTLRSSPRVKPPADLEARISSVVLAAQATTRTGAGAAGTPRHRVRYGIAAAALILVALVGYAIGSRATQATLGNVEERLDAETERRAFLAERVGDLQGAVSLAREQLTAREASHAASAAAWREKESRLEAMLVDAVESGKLCRETTRRLERTVANLEASHSQLRSDADELEAAVVRLSSEQSIAAAELAALRRRNEALGQRLRESEAALAAERGVPREPPVVFRTRERGLEVEVIDSRREKVIPYLVDIAADASDPERATLALSTLESLVPPLPGQSLSPPDAGPPGFFERVFSADLLASDEVVEPDRRPQDSHEERLDRVLRTLQLRGGPRPGASQ